MRRMIHLFATAALLLGLPAVANAASLELQADLTNKKLHAFVDGKLVETWTVAVGTDRHPTPTGEFFIDKMIWNPGWVPPPNDWAKDATAKKPGDPDNPMRVVKIFFKQPDYYIHGTNRPETLGTAASHGCIRMSEADVFELGKMVMEHSGEWRHPSWFRRIFTRDTSDTVYLGKPVNLLVAKELDIDQPKPSEDDVEVPSYVGGGN